EFQQLFAINPTNTLSEPPFLAGLPILKRFSALLINNLFCLSLEGNGGGFTPVLLQDLSKSQL
ncbi:MAG: hypothetical protein ABIP27_04970, partial [Flavobacterium circumlabens]|uniref:hypothetical protein n=1 Tax=Flavobacterium circumlabens TaxID=2133765 RepID=UPI0032657CB9